MEDVTEWDPDEIARHATEVTTIKEKLYERASKNITCAQDKEYYKKRCDSQVRKVWLHPCTRQLESLMQVYTRGTLVMVRNSARESKKGDKMKPPWLGPYSIEESLGWVRVCIDQDYKTTRKS